MGWLANQIKKAITEVMSKDKDSILQIQKLNEELENLKLKRRLEETEILSLMKIEKEKGKLEMAQERTKMQDEFNKKEMDLMKGYHQQTLTLLEKQEETMTVTYNEIMKRLPNVNVKLDKLGQ